LKEKYKLSTTSKSSGILDHRIALQKIIKGLLQSKEDIRRFYSQTERCEEK
jgi:hypothetical protein